MARTPRIARRFGARTSVVWALLMAGLGTAGSPSAFADATALTYFGAAGSFGTMAHGAPGVTSITTHAVPGWGFRPGQAVYFTAVAGDGTVFMANEPQTDNQFLPTADQMVVSAYSPAADRFEDVVVPTSRERTRTAKDGVGEVGGGDISDIGVVPTPTGPRVAFLSTAPYHNWDIEADGEYPTLGYLARVAGRWTDDRSRSRTASELAAQNGPDGPCRQGVNSRWQRIADCHAVTEMAVLPRSGELAVTQYVAAPGEGRTSGDLLVMDAAGHAKARYALPDVTLPDGTRVAVHPREINADPTSPAGDERFVVIFDALVGAGTPAQRHVPFTAQEFSYRAGTGTISPTSLPVLSGQTADGRPLGFETGQFDAQGRLWLAQAVNGTLNGGPLAVYEALADGGTLSRRGCAARPEWSGQGWGTACPPSASVDAASGLGIVRSLTSHPQGGVLAATMSGFVLPVSSADGIYQARPVLDLGLNRLVDRRNAWVGPRKGSVEPVSGDLWLPIQQLQTTASCPLQPCAPVALDQWLARIDVARALAPPGPPVPSPALPRAEAPTAPAALPVASAAPGVVHGAAPVARPPGSVPRAVASRLRFARELSQGTLLSGRALVEVSCRVRCVVSAELRTSGGTRRLLGRARTSARARTVRLRLRVPRGGRSRLTRTGPTRADLVVRVSAGKGAPQILRVTSRIRSPRRR